MSISFSVLAVNTSPSVFYPLPVQAQGNFLAAKNLYLGAGGGLWVHDVHGKVLFGTDFPVPYMVRFNTFDLNSTKRKQFSRIENPFDRYLSVLFEYFPTDSEIYQNHNKVVLT